MTQTRIRLTRAELYEKVWTTPVRTIAQEFGMSDVGLAKICRKHGIPIPPLGYWRKTETGHKVVRPPLSPATNGLETLDISVRERLPPELAALAAEPALEIAIPSELSHDLVTRTEKLLASGKENEKKLVVPKGGTLAHHERPFSGTRRERSLDLVAKERRGSLDVGYRWRNGEVLCAGNYRKPAT